MSRISFRGRKPTKNEVLATIAAVEPDVIKELQQYDDLGPTGCIGYFTGCVVAELLHRNYDIDPAKDGFAIADIIMSFYDLSKAFPYTKAQIMEDIKR